ncbi:DNA polymerase beta superfamily protein [Kitasatospora sp. NPDC006697]|uniref:nucleotidyltransferase domain-containing protein n=1 Tax=Kitasatospora sp. NPDC006697 TaxID=3364020 RepID=UPI00369F9F6B
MNILLSGIVGSTAYGLAHAGSDIDRLGLFAVATADLHGLHRPTESKVTTKPDRTLHEAAKWCRLALSCNPTAMELAWLPAELYEVRTPLGDELIAIRDSFLSANAVRNAYLGYATHQIRKLQSRAQRPLDDEARARSAKHARHVLRLLHQGVGLHRTGELTIRLSDPAALRAEAERIVAEPPLGEAHLARAEAEFTTPGVLPAQPDERPAEAWLRKVRAEFYG